MCLLLWIGTHARGAEPLALLEPGTPFTGTIGGQDKFHLAWPAEAGQAYLLVLDQGGLDLVLSVTWPDGISQAANSPLLRDGGEVLLVEASVAGMYRVELVSHEHTGASANFTLEVRRLSGEPARVRDELPVLRAMTRAARDHHLGTPESWASARDHYRQAASLGTGLWEAQSIYSLAMIEYWQLLQWDAAAASAARAAALYSDLGEAGLAANAIALQAAAIIEKAHGVRKSSSGGLAPEAAALFDEAFGLFAQALRVQEAQGQYYDAAKTINNIGLTHYYRGQLAEAEPLYLRAAHMFREMNEWEAEFIPRVNIGVIQFEQGRLSEAIATYERTLSIWPPGVSEDFRAATINNRAASHRALGSLDEALQGFSEALDIYRATSNIKGQGRSLAGIGTSYYAIGETDLALEYLQNSLSLHREANNGRGQVSVLNFIGNIKRENGDHSGSLAAHQAALELATSPLDRYRCRLLLALDLVSGGKPNDALLQLSDPANEEGAAGNARLAADRALVTGMAYLALDEPGRAASVFSAAASGYDDLGLRAEQAQAVFGRARSQRQLKALDEAERDARAAIHLTEVLREQLIEPEFRAFFLSKRQDYYAFLVDLLMSRHATSGEPSSIHLRAALEVNERSRARALVDLVNEAGVYQPDSKSNESQRQLQTLYRRLAEGRYRLNRLLESDEGWAATQAPGIDAIKGEMAEIENRLNLLRMSIREQHPEIAALTAPRLLDSSQMQALLGEDTVLLQYGLGAERSYVWQVTRDRLSGHPLPPRSNIEGLARQVHAQLNSPGFTAQARASLKAAIDALSAAVLGPVGPIGHARVVIVADGALQYLPFSVLRKPGQDGSFLPLLESHELVHLPSLSVMAMQRRAGRQASPPNKLLAIFADPVFDPSDQRFPAQAGGVADEPDRPRASAPMTRLPSTSVEAARIAELVELNNRHVATGFEANRNAILQSSLGDYRFIHFATHGLVDSRYPALSALAMSRFDAQGNPQDGLLRLHDLYNLDLNADLVVLSACSTALGREIAGEGLTGLTHGLMHSGAKAVLASLWQVPNRATAELMSLFYQNLLQHQQSPASALRAAQLALATQPRWRSPYFWGAFVLQGEWL